MDSKGECDQLNLAHVATNIKIYLKKEKQTNKRQCPLYSSLNNRPNDISL